MDKCGIRQDRVSCDARLSHSLHTFSAPLNWVSQRALSLYFVFCILYFTLNILYFVFNIQYFVFCISHLVFCILYFKLSIMYFVFVYHFTLFQRHSIGSRSVRYLSPRPIQPAVSYSKYKNIKIQKYKFNGLLAWDPTPITFWRGSENVTRWYDLLTW